MRNSMFMKLAVWFFAFFLLLETTSFGQNQDNDPYKARRYQLQQKIQRVRMQQMKQSLEISEEKLKTLDKIISKYEEEGLELRRKQIEIQQDLRRNKQLSSEQVQERVRKLQQTEDRLHEIKQQEFKEVSQHLNPQQQGRYIIFREDFNRNVNRIVHQNGRGRRNQN